MYDYKGIPGLPVRLGTQETRILREDCGKHIYIVAMKTTWIASSYLLGLYFTFLYIFKGKECYETYITIQKVFLEENAYICFT